MINLNGKDYLSKQEVLDFTRMVLYMAFDHNPTLHMENLLETFINGTRDREE